MLHFLLLPLLQKMVFAHWIKTPTTFPTTSCANHLNFNLFSLSFGISAVPVLNYSATYHEIKSLSAKTLSPWIRMGTLRQILGLYHRPFCRSMWIRQVFVWGWTLACRKGFTSRVGPARLVGRTGKPGCRPALVSDSTYLLIFLMDLE